MNKNLFFMLLCCFMFAQSIVLGSALLKETAVNGKVTGSSAVTYNSSDISGIRAFLMQYSEETQKWNYEVVGLSSENMDFSKNSNLELVMDRLKNNLVWKEWGSKKFVTEIVFVSKPLKGDFDGKYFVYLEKLDLVSCQISVIDVSQNFQLKYLDCSNNKLTNLNVSKNLKLNSLYCSFNDLTRLDLSQNSQLNSIFCNKNKLTSLNLSKIFQLKNLDCSYNQLMNLDLSKNFQLTDLSCQYNKLKELNLSTNQLLLKVYCYNNQLAFLDVSKNPKLFDLYCSYNQLNSLDVSKNTKLKNLSCGTNQLTSLDVSNNLYLIYLECSSNRLTNLNVFKNIQLVSLDCLSNQITSLDVSKNFQLSSLNCSSNQLTSLDFTKNPQLKSLNCSSNQLISLDVYSNTYLNNLDCYANQLKFSTLKGSFKNNKMTHIKIDPQEIIQGGTKGFFELLDLSSEYSVNGTATTYTWYDKVTGQEVGMFAYNGSFYAGPANAGKTLFCKMSNSLYPGLILEYEVTITNSTNALSKTMETSIPENFKFTGPDVGIMELKVYPNPATEVVKISTSMLIGSVTIYDYSGKEIKRLRTVPNNEINVKDLASGGYILAIQTQQGIITKKFIKK